MFATLESNIFTNNDYEFDENIDCVAYSMKGKYSKTYNDATDLLIAARAYITEKLNEQQQIMTDPNNNIELHNAQNAFYIDLDYMTTLTDKQKQQSFNMYLAKTYIQVFARVVSNIDYYYFTFVSSTFPKTNNMFKGGVHILIFANRNFDKTERLDIYNKMNTLIKSNAKVWQSISKFVHNTDTLFDLAPIKSCNILFPFAQKDKHKRQYIYCPNLSKYNNENWFVLNATQTKPLDIGVNNKVADDINYYIDQMEMDIESDPIEQQTESQNEPSNEVFIIRGEHRLYPENILHNKALLLYNFVSSFKYLSNEHPFWQILLGTQNNGHNVYYYDFVQPYYKMLVLLNMYSSDDEHDFNKYRKISNKKLKPNYITYDILELVARQLASICLTTKQSTNDMSGRYTYEGQLSNMKTMFYNKYYDKLFTKKLTDIEGLQTYSEIYFTMKIFNFNITKECIKTLELNDIDTIKTISKTLNKLKQFAKSTIDSFINVITDFCEGITNEIEPFTKYKSYYHQTCYVNDSDEKLIDGNNNEEMVSFYHVDPKFNIGCTGNIIDTTYENIVKLWFSVCLIFNYISANFQLQPAIKNTIGAFIKQYISVDMSGAIKRVDKYKNILIYNVRQTIELEKYPYNQWIPDSKSSILLDIWATKLYQHYIVDCLTQEFNDNKVYGFIKLFVDNHLYIAKVLNNIKVLPHADKDLSEMLNNIIKTHPTESRNAPASIDIESANIFPMRNGWLEFYWKDSKTSTGYEDNQPSCLRFSYVNRDKCTESHTNVPWVGDVDQYLQWIKQPENAEAKHAYERICSMCEQIYPEHDELVYNMSLFASVLYGNDEKNMIHVMFGTGADGKTTMTTAIFSMLDTEGFTNDVYITEHGRKIQVEALEGLGSTMKTETLLVSTSKYSGHDEGGRACMIHKRFISVSEPDPHLSGGNLNGAAIKEITGGSAIQARKLYKSAVSVQANSFITFQTNDFPGTDDTSRGFRRRLSVYQHRSKFKTEDEINDDKTVKNIKYAYESDNSLNDNLKKNIYFKQAMFYYLLPYAKRNIANNWRSLQKIPKPQYVIDGINQVLSRASGITKWFCDNLDECDKFVDDIGNKVLPIINIKSMLDKMIRTNRENQVVKLWKKFADVNEEQKHLIRAVQNYFEQQLFKLQPQYYISTGQSKILDKNNKELMLFINATNIEHSNAAINCFDNLEELQHMFLSQFAVNSATQSEVSNFEDLFLVGYVLKTTSEQHGQTTDDMDGYMDD